MRKSSIIPLLLAIALLLVGCKDNTGGSSPDDTVPPTNTAQGGDKAEAPSELSGDSIQLYKKTSLIDLPGILNFQVHDGKAYALAPGEDGNWGVFADGQKLCSTGYNFVVTDDGIWTFKAELTPEQDGEDTYLIKLNFQGEEEFRTHLVTNYFSGFDYVGYHRLAADKDGNIYLPGENNDFTGESGAVVSVYSPGGELLREIELKYSIDSMATGADGSVYVTSRDWEKMSTSLFSLDEGQENEAIFTAEDFRPEMQSGGGAYNLLFTDTTGLYSLNDGELETITRWGDSCIVFSYYAEASMDVAVWDDERFIFADRYGLCLLEPTDDPGKEILTIACYDDPTVFRMITEFNLMSGSYFVNPVRYSEYGSEDEAVTKLNTEIISGKYPDMINLDSLPVKKAYSDKGLFLDVSDKLGKTEGLELDDILFLDLMQQDGALYSLPSSYSIVSCYGYTSRLGSIDELNYDNAKELSFQMTAIELLGYCLPMYIDSAIDYKAGTCSFDSPEFIALLEMVASADTAPPQMNGSEETGAYNPPNEDYDVLLGNIGSIYNLRNMESERDPFNPQWEKNPVTFLGMPTPDGKSGVMAIPQGEVAICSYSENIDGCWEFLSFMLKETGDRAWGTPVLKSTMDAIYEEILNPMAQFEGMEIIHNEGGGFYADGVFHDITYDETPHMSQTQIDKYEKLLDDVQCIYSYDRMVVNIILEEAERFFFGNKTAQQTAEIIQSRASKYVAEQS